MHRRDKTTDVMTQHLTERFVYLCSTGLASDLISKLRLNHVEATLNIRALVVILHKPLLIVLEVMKHLFPDRKGVLIRY